MVIWKWWNRGPNYEEELPKLAEDIRNYQFKLISVTSTHRRWRAIAFMILLLSYAIILGYVFVVHRPDPRHFAAPYSDVWRYVHVFADPVLAYLLYTTLTRTLRWRENKLRNTLNELTEKRKALLTAYKKTINFDKIQKIIGEPLQGTESAIDQKNRQPPQSERRDIPRNGSSATPNISAAAHAGMQPQKIITTKSLSSGNTNPDGATPPINASASEVQNTEKVPNGSGVNSENAAAEIKNHAEKNGASTASWYSNNPNHITQLPVYHTSWVDRILDLILGENEQGPNRRYALICSNCHVHNGLAPFGKSADEVTYICPVCGTLNDPKVDLKVQANSASEPALDQTRVSAATSKEGSPVKGSSAEFPDLQDLSESAKAATSETAADSLESAKHSNSTAESSSTVAKSSEAQLRKRGA